jgi:hypothetical protein
MRIISIIFFKSNFQKTTATEILRVTKRITKKDTNTNKPKKNFNKRKKARHSSWNFALHLTKLFKLLNNQKDKLFQYNDDYFLNLSQNNKRNRFIQKAKEHFINTKQLIEDDTGKLVSGKIYLPNQEQWLTKQEQLIFRISTDQWYVPNYEHCFFNDQLLSFGRVFIVYIKLALIDIYTNVCDIGITQCLRLLQSKYINEQNDLKDILKNKLLNCIDSFNNTENKQKLYQSQKLRDISIQQRDDYLQTLITKLKFYINTVTEKFNEVIQFIDAHQLANCPMLYLNTIKKTTKIKKRKTNNTTLISKQQIVETIDEQHKQIDDQMKQINIYSDYYQLLQNENPLYNKEKFDEIPKEDLYQKIHNHDQYISQTMSILSIPLSQKEQSNRDSLSYLLYQREEY